MYIDFGKITSTHGIRGEVKIYPYTDDVDNILNLKKIYIEGKGYKNGKFNLHSSRIISNVTLIFDNNSVVNNPNDTVLIWIAENKGTY